MPSERYYRQQATALLSWARATHDRAWARLLRQRAAYELERAADDRTAITDLNPLLADFNEQQRFFERHLKPWAARMFADLEMSQAAGFYRGLGRVGRIFMELESEAFTLSQ